MKVQVSWCWHGGNRHSVQLDWQGKRDRVYHAGVDWSRALAGQCLDLLKLHGVKRRNVRFEVN